MAKVSQPTAFCMPALPTRGQKTLSRPAWICSASRGDERFAVSRRALLAALTGFAVHVGAGNPMKVRAEGKEGSTDKKPLTGFMTRTGLKYFDFEIGEGPTPNWGDMVNIKYVAYTISASGDALVKHDSSDSYGKNGYLIHHGNGEQILGLEEAIHSMGAGGRRRAIIPPSLAYSQSNLGPVPASDRKRRKFSTALLEGDGTVVFDVEVTRIWKDPEDRGYYSDLTPTPEEMLQIMTSKNEE